MVDDRVPGESTVEMHLYTCRYGDYTAWAASPPMCPTHHIKMDITDEPPLEDRREAIRRAREEAGE